MTPRELADEFSEASGRTFSHVRELVGGETGANEFIESDGTSWVIKTVTNPDSMVRRREAVAVSERLRLEAAWPAPFREVVQGNGRLFVLQAFVVGEAVTVLNDSHVTDVLAAHDRRRGLAGSDTSTAFADHIIHTLTQGGDNYCCHGPLYAHSDRGRRFVERARAIGGALTPADLPGDDLIHWDLHPGNMIERSGRLVGIIDLDNAKVGDGVVDLAMLALSARMPGNPVSARLALFDAGIRSLSEAQHDAYLAHYILRFADWAVRKNRPADLAFWLDQVDELLT